MNSHVFLLKLDIEPALRIYHTYVCLMCSPFVRYKETRAEDRTHINLLDES